jgi:hypothetical protein
MRNRGEIFKLIESKLNFSKMYHVKVIFCCLNVKVISKFSILVGYKLYYFIKVYDTILVCSMRRVHFVKTRTPEIEKKFQQYCNSIKKCTFFGTELQERFQSQNLS